MSTAQLTLWVFALVVGFFSALLQRNPTALALVLAFAASEARLPPTYYTHPDILTVALIFAKGRYRPCEAYWDLSVWGQLKCIITERAPSDRFVLLSIPMAWYFYAPALSHTQWWSLYWIAVAQFIVVAIAPLTDLRSVPVGEPQTGRSLLAKLNSILKINKRTRNFVVATGSGGYPETSFDISENSSFSAGVVDAPRGVPQIGLVRAISEIGDSVVGRDAIDVVDFARWPSAKMHGPSNTVSACVVSSDTRLPISFGADCKESLFPGVSGVPCPATPIARKHVERPRKPEQLAGFRLIAEKLTKRFRGGYFSDSHCALQSHEGQGRAVSQAPFRPAFHSTSRPVHQTRAAELTLASGGGGDG